MEETIAMSLIAFVCIYFAKKDKANKPYLDRVKGDLGEDKVAAHLNRLSCDYHVIHDVRYPHCQIDHLVICDKTKKIYVIETKNWRGRITGTKDDDYWILKTKKKEFYYKNPLKQNEWHCEKVRGRFQDYMVYSIVVFTNENVTWQCKYKNVIRLGELISYIEQKNM